MIEVDKAQEGILNPVSFNILMHVLIDIIVDDTARLKPCEHTLGMVKADHYSF